MLILDEPTSGVDPMARDQFWKLLIDLSRNQGVTIFISTHFMNEAARCDRIALMDAGRVLATGTPADLTKIWPKSANASASVPSPFWILDGAGWHSSPQLILPENIVLMPLPSYAPELNSVENIWDYLRSNFLSHCVWDTYDAILDACCDAWNALMAKSEVIASIGTREWAQVRI